MIAGKVQNVSLASAHGPYFEIMASAESLPDVSFADVAAAIRRADLPPVDVVVGIGTGGTVPAALVAYHLGVPLCMDWYQYRGPDNAPVEKSPRLLAASSIPSGATRILLVDDVCVTGSTLQAAASRLAEYDVTTLVVKGRADIVLMPNLETCVRWPWHHY